MTYQAELILLNGKIATQNDRRSFAEALAIRDGKFLAVGTEREIMALKSDSTKVVNLNGRTVIPGLNDSHMHLIGGLNYNMELRWDGVPSLADGLRMLREQAGRTPAGQWVRVVGGWTEFQFAERRMPTLDELNRAAPVSVAPGEGAIMAAPEGTTLPMVDGSEWGITRAGHNFLEDFP
jgi:predicted amidohydrolase YtcJ